jgi:hypothetical protein
VLKRPGLAVCCLFLLVAQALAEEARNYQILPLSDRITQCRTEQAHANCVISKILVLKPNSELAACTANVDIGAREFQFSPAVPAPSCQPIQCSRCDLIPSISPTENRLELYRPFSFFQPLTIDGAVYWAINQQTGLLTVCAMDPPFAECKTVTP